MSSWHEHPKAPQRQRATGKLAAHECRPWRGDEFFQFTTTDFINCFTGTSNTILIINRFFSSFCAPYSHSGRRVCWQRRGGPWVGGQPTAGLTHRGRQPLAPMVNLDNAKCWRVQVWRDSSSESPNKWNLRQESQHHNSIIHVYCQLWNQEFSQVYSHVGVVGVYVNSEYTSASTYLLHFIDFSRLFWMSVYVKHNLPHLCR